MGGARRNIFVLLFVLGLVLVSALVVVKKPAELGLDLQGGIELTLQGRPTPQVKEVTTEAMERSVEIIRSGCDRLGVSEIEVSRLGADQISVGIPGATSVGKATECATKPARLYFYDWQNNLLGPAKEIATDKGTQDPAQVLKQQRQKWIDADRPPTQGFNRQLLTQGAEPTMWEAVNLATEQPRNDKCEDCSSPDRFYLFEEKEPHKLLSGPATAKEDLYFDEQGNPIPEEGIVKRVPQGTVVVAELPTDPATGRSVEDESQAAFFVLEDHPALSGSDIKDPQQQLDEFNQPNVTFDFTSQGRNAFQRITRTIAQEGQARAIGAVGSEEAAALSGNFAIILDGQVVSRPIINFAENPDGIDGRTGAQISGGFDVAEAQNLAEFLQRGALPIDLKLTSQSQVSASLGKEALDQGVIAIVVGLLFVVLFLLIFYRFLGLVASLALISYALIFLCLIKLIPITLTLPGIAGLVLTIGVAADSNIVIFERIKEELRAGRSVASAVKIGYRMGISTIIDANVVTLLTAFILFVLATSGIKGFAFTLGIGTLVSLLTAVVFTQAMLGAMGNTHFLRSGRGFGGIEGKQRWHYDFIGSAKYMFAISGVILLVGAGALATKGLSFGIDFESGTRVEVSLKQEGVTADELRTALTKDGLGDSTIQGVNNEALGANAFQIQSATLDPSEIAKVEETLDKSFGVSQGGFNSTSVGPTFGASVAKSATLAIFFSLILIMGYVAFRFGGKYTLPILIAIVHDFLIALGIFALLGFEVSSATVAAFLTILGYSQYDTIIVFDRIRENEPKMPRATYSQIVNKSMSEVMTRSLATSFSTLAAVVALLIFGGETLGAFAIAILVGIASGTYSSLFIASPVLTLWKERESTFRRRHRQQIETQGYVPAFASDLEVAKHDGENEPATEGGPGDIQTSGRGTS